MPADMEWRMWRQLKGAFSIDRFVFSDIQEGVDRYPLEQFATMEEALATCTGARIFLEPSVPKGMSDIPLTGDIVLVLGNTAMGNSDLALPEECYAISTPNPTDMYGINAAAIALAYRVGQ